MKSTISAATPPAAFKHGSLVRSTLYPETVVLTNGTRTPGSPNSFCGVVIACAVESDVGKDSIDFSKNLFASFTGTITLEQ